jgi:hypothetical protein
MYTTFHVNANELNENFIEGIKAIFKSKHFAIIVEEELDETDYLLSSETNKEILEQSLAESDAGNIIKVDIDKYLSKK